METSTKPEAVLERTPVRVKQLQRASRALHVVPHDPVAGQYFVESATQPGTVYQVTLTAGALSGQCSCPWGQHGGVNCKHVMAALRAHYAAQGSLSFWRSRTDARRQHRRLIGGDRLYLTLRPRVRSDARPAA